MAFVEREEYAESDSVVTRLASVVAGTANRSNIARASIREPAQIVSGPDIGGVSLKFLDLSSASVTGTFKDWVACLTAAYCLQQGVPALITQSSGNTANALARYAEHCGINAIILYPRLSRYKINSAGATGQHITMVEVDHPEPQLKIWADEAARRYGLPWLPRLDLQREGNKLRGYFIANWLRESGAECDWLAQALSSAFGPIGTYRGFRELLPGFAVSDWPRFLGVQQEAVHPFATDIANEPPPDVACEMLEPTLFRTAPNSDLYEEMRWICQTTEGAVTVVTNDEVRARLGEVEELLGRQGFRLTRVETDRGERVLELSSAICLVGVLQAIETGLIRPSQSVLVTLTGGLAASRQEEFEPVHRVEATADATKLWKILDGLAR